MRKKIATTNFKRVKLLLIYCIRSNPVQSIFLKIGKAFIGYFACWNVQLCQCRWENCGIVGNFITLQEKQLLPQFATFASLCSLFPFSPECFLSIRLTETRVRHARIFVRAGKRTGRSSCASIGNLLDDSRHLNYATQKLCRFRNNYPVC